jgi:YgiT-type zinc finger domain-containing protein
MASKWHGKQCPLCNEGTLRDGKIKRQLEYRGRVFESTVKGAFCNQCADGFPEHDDHEEAAGPDSAGSRQARRRGEECLFPL